MFKVGEEKNWYRYIILYIEELLQNLRDKKAAELKLKNWTPEQGKGFGIRNERYGNIN
jgi:hypothetical protein